MTYSDVTDTERYYICGGHNEKLRKYANDVRFSNAQLTLIRYGIENGIDVTIYANPDIPEECMKQIFYALKKPRRFVVRYWQDNTVCVSYHTTDTKLEALYEFFKRFPNFSSSVIDIRED